MERPELNKNISLKDFNDFYWLKQELSDFCRELGISGSGGKIEITERIRQYLSTGKIPKPDKGKIIPKSKFDWNRERLTRLTIITDNYKNTENVRKFFLEEIGSHFSFNVLFMNWIKENVGKTLAEAVGEWKRINEMKKGKSFESEIDPQFEYNRYMRDFLKDNPGLTRKDAIHYWKLKRSKRGPRKYEASDLDLE